MNLLFRSGLDISQSHCSCFPNNPWASWTGEAKVSPAVQKNDLMWNKVDFSHRPPSEACRTGGFIFDPACCPFGRKTIPRNADAMTGTENDSRAFFGPILIFAHVLTGTIKKEGLQTVLQSSTSRRYVRVFLLSFFFCTPCINLHLEDGNWFRVQQSDLSDI